MATGALIPALNVEVGSLLSGQISALRKVHGASILRQRPKQHLPMVATEFINPAHSWLLAHWRP
ncbi:MAG: hypothetical protein J0H63_13425, partial [Rhizobiales bacterium]|nr:hypothetical protein [Hyphomicrobiales bacterium]